MRALFLAMVLVCASAGTAFADEAKCTLTPADKAANARLSFDDFDQKGVTPSTWRALEVAGCRKQAVEAAQDYLVNGPPQTAGAKSIILFHIAQTLAIDGDNTRAALMVATALYPDHASPPDLDWETYLRGTWAFLVRDKAMLDVSVAKLLRETGDGNRINGGVLKGLSACFDKPYAEAYLGCGSPKK